MLGLNETLDQLAGSMRLALKPQWVLWWSCVDEA